MATVHPPRRARRARTSAPADDRDFDIEEPVILFHQMTSDQFCGLPECEQFDLELLDGAVVMASKPVPAHQYLLAQLVAVLVYWVKTHQLGRILIDTLMKLDGKWTPAPDLVFLKTAHLKRVRRKRIVGPVDLAVEILSPSSKTIDWKTKFATYARFGIAWYWILDLEQRVLEEYELAGGKYQCVDSVAFDQPFAPRLFPGLTIDLASLEW